jgi:uncharacterized membrane protein HdeD (DUF308 family)
MIRLLYLTHRYLGIALGLLMVLWCVTGIVMIYVPYPASIAREARLAGLEPLSAAPCCTLEGQYFPADDTQIERFEIETQNGRALLTASNPGGRTYILDVSRGAAFEGATPETALDVARDFSRGHGIAGDPSLESELDSDQWTTGRFRIDRPLYKFDLNDDAGSEIYISSTSGRVVQYTTWSLRFWNWLGSVPHWLYFTQLREDVALWTDVVVWTSLIGCFLTIIGIYIGIRQLKRRRSTGKLASPYRGLWYWHHIPGLIFGVFTLTWVFSGLLSMTPWGLFSGTDPSPALEKLYGGAPRWADVKQAIPALVSAAPAGTVNIQFAPFDGGLYAMASGADGSAVRLNSNGVRAPMSESDYARAASLIGEAYDGVSWDVLEDDDAYYYFRENAPVPFPVLRVSTTGANAAYFYVSPDSAQIRLYADAGSRQHRWLFSGLHSLDFTATLRWRPFWDLMMIVLLLGATAVCGTGAWLGLRYLLGNKRGQGFFANAKRREPA